jgi:hypothetical protein
MRVAVSGAHRTGKSTLIAAFLAQRPQYAHEPEAYEDLADDIALLAFEGPDIEGLAALLVHTVSTIGGHGPGAAVIFERSPVDYLAYAAATRSIARAERDEFLRTRMLRLVLSSSPPCQTDNSRSWSALRHMVASRERVGVEPLVPGPVPRLLVHNEIG